MKDLLATVKSNKKIAENIYMLTLSLPGDAGKMHGGQFLTLSTGNGANLLRRPLGVCIAEGDEVSVCYQIKGKGTTYLASVQPGRKLRVLLPLGNWFDLDDCTDIVAIGGGVGIFPLIATIREYSKTKNFYTYAGFRNVDAVCLWSELNKSKKLTITTDDGSFGEKGNAVSAYLNDVSNVKADVIISCGPPVMLRILKQKLKEQGIKTPCFVSLEERMGCGLGACLVCVCKTEQGENVRVCRDGPVFDINEVLL